ncbi:RNA-directed DNA polymerase [Nodularia spumigena CS-586/05]|uniref:RNA-directed DNA polymerase n=1 Tax=Nodularia spumigena TaxID=70799 RepID=UPI00232DCE29|nr:RNA-directed DNA polymerase [Nodularia spumigena]MDB9343412.1 RNA-directed DNA polymerase [Nodularia spumigena CS-588/06]MDB9369145.1 RNA-directed DNA polymerase [Nodularia spumigena CS-586/05]
MKRHGNLWSQITEFENLLIAARQAQRGKRFRDSILEFNYNLESELAQLKTELDNKTYQPGAYHTFEIVEPKKRIISAAPYRDRVVHHALCNIIAPIFERTFIADSYANRVGFGTHRALRRFTKFARSSRYVLQCDIRKYFPSIDHEILKSLLRRKLKCQDTLWLTDTIINNSNEQEPILDHFPGDDLFTPLQRRRGLPIGNLTSQFFANTYLNGFDHFVKENLPAAKYVRYVDDFSIFADDWDFLAAAREAIENYLVQLRLKIHPVKSQLFATHHGANFLGFRILPDRIRVRTENLRRARRRLRRMQQRYIQGKMGEKEISQSIQSWVAHLEHGDTWQLRQQIFATLDFTRG